MMESVSVIIPTFDRRDLLQRAVQSCLQQTHPILEILVCDDGSTDGSREMIASIGDARVKWIDGPRAGRPAVPRNRGLRSAQGDWVAFLDSDDAWHPAKLTQQLAAVGISDASASCTNALRIIDGRAAGDYFSRDHGTITLKKMIPENPVICSSMLVRRQIALKAGGFPEEVEMTAIEDHAYWIRIACFTDIDYLHGPLTLYTDSPGTSLRSGSLDPSVHTDLVKQNVRSWSASAAMDKTSSQFLANDANWHARRPGLMERIIRRLQ
jgi:glycosyltransferase involved in cell wall biosynthesis